MKRALTTALVLRTLLWICIFSCNGDRSEYSRRIDALFATEFADSAPGAAILVSRNGEILLRKGYGLADIEHRVPMTPDMVFRAATITKQFTAVAILLLSESGRLSLDDPITKFIPEYPVEDTPITIRHLLTHTSGIRSYTSLTKYWERAREDLSHKEMLDLFATMSPDFEPGEGWKYNNSGFYLLGMIIERASGIPYAQFIQERIIAPLGLHHTAMDSPTEIVPRRASGYTWAGAVVANADYISNTGPFSAGGLITSVDDLARWDASLYTEALLPSAAIRRCFEPFWVPSIGPAPFAFGWGARTTRGRRAFINGGYITGFKVCTVRVPEERIFVAVLENSFGRATNTEVLARQAAAIAMGDPYVDEQPVPLTPEVLDRYTGVYRSERGFTTTVTRENHGLGVRHSGGQTLKAIPSSMTRFFHPGSFASLEFALDDSGRVQRLFLYYDADTAVAIRTNDEVPAKPQSIEIDSKIFSRLEGSYEIIPGYNMRIFREVLQEALEERSFGIVTGLQLTVFRQTERYLMQFPGQNPVEILAESACTFFSPDSDIRLEFEPCEDGQIRRVLLMSKTGMTVAQRIPNS